MARKPPANPGRRVARLGREFVSAGPGKPPGSAPLRAVPEASAILSFLDELGRLAADLWAEGRLHNFPSNNEKPDDDD